MTSRNIIQKILKSATFKVSVMIVLMVSMLAMTGCGNKTDVEDTGFYLDTECTVTIYQIDEDEGDELLEQSFDICEKYENMLSKTVKGSDVDKINKAKGKWTEVNDETVEVIKAGLEMSKVSDGAFDITVGRLTDLWDFKAENPKVPADSDVKAAVKTVDYKGVEVDGNKVKLKDKGAKIDLGGIAKGFIADKITELLKGEGVEQAIINLGGNVVTIGEKEEGTPWNIGVERPYSDRSEVIGAVPAADKAVVTSGVYERMFKRNGKLYHHIIDPKTGYPVTSDVEAVTIIGESGTSMECDGYSTICLLLGQEKGMKLIEGDDSKEALFIDKNDNTKQTEGMEFVQQ